MHIFGDILIVLNNKTELLGKILVSDVFDVNDCLKTSLVIDFDEKYNINKFLTHKDIDYVVFNVDFMNTFFYGYFCIEKIDNEVDEELNDVYIEEDYSNGNISRFYINIDSFDSIMLLDRQFRMFDCLDNVNTNLKDIYENKLKRREDLSLVN